MQNPQKDLCNLVFLSISFDFNLNQTKLTTATSKMGRFVTIVNGLRSTLDVAAGLDPFLESTPNFK